MTSTLCCPTTVVGSYPQPDWLVDRQLLSKGVARVRLDLWRVPRAVAGTGAGRRDAARDPRHGARRHRHHHRRRDAAGELFQPLRDRRSRASTCGKPGQVVSKAGLATAVPRVVGPIRRTRPVEVRDMEFLRRNTDRAAKITLPGPFTMSQQAVNEYYRDADEMVMDYAAAVNAEARDLEKAGADVIQLDEPWLRQDPTAAKRIAVKAINRALEGVSVTDRGAPVLRLCGGRRRAEAGRLLVPAELADVRCGPDFHRGGAAEAGSRRAQGPCAARRSCSASSISPIPRRKHRRRSRIAFARP